MLSTSISLGSRKTQQDLKSLGIEPFPFLPGRPSASLERSVCCVSDGGVCALPSCSLCTGPHLDKGPLQM